MSKKKKVSSIVNEALITHSLGFGLRWEQTPEEKKAYEVRQRKEKKRSEEAQQERARQLEDFGATGWRDMKDCPLWAYEKTYGIESLLLVRKDKEIALVRPKERFGTPMVCVEPGDTVIRNGMFYTEAKYEKPKNPKWWFKYELENYMSHDSEMYGKDEIDFIPTHWKPLPLNGESIYITNRVTLDLGKKK